MRRWLLILILMVVPAQFVWAAAAPYCAHETSPTAKKHIGHHEHRHQAGDTQTPTSGDDDLPGMTSHADCQFCHLSASASIPSAVRLMGVPPPAPPPAGLHPAYLSHVPSGPERPDRSDSSAAVRIGGGVAFGPPLT